jgi:isocitrate dehydrogenase
MEEGFLRWDSLGEFLALAVSLEDLAYKTQNSKAQVLADTLNQAIGRFLDEDKSPGRKVGQIDNRGSHVYLTQYWLNALSEQTQSPELQSAVASASASMNAQMTQILQELAQAQGKTLDLGGYYHPDTAKLAQAMRPSETFNQIIAQLS